MSLNQIYGYLEAINNKGDKDIENFMHDPDTELIDQSSMEKGDVDSDLSPIKKCIETGIHVISTSITIDILIRIAKPDLDTDDEDVPLSSLKAPKDDEEWKWRKQLEKCKFTKKSIVIIKIRNLSPIQVSSQTVALDGVLLLIKIELERYAEQNESMLQTTSGKLWALLGKTFLMDMRLLGS